MAFYDRSKRFLEDFDRAADGVERAGRPIAETAKAAQRASTRLALITAATIIVVTVILITAFLAVM